MNFKNFWIRIGFVEKEMRQKEPVLRGKEQRTSGLKRPSRCICPLPIQTVPFYKNNNRKCFVSNACGCFEMVEATGVEPVS